MNLIRRILSILIPALFIGGLVYGYLWFKGGTDNYQKLTANLRNHSNIWSEFKSYDLIDHIDHQIAEIDSYARRSPNFNAILNSPVIISVNPVSNEYELLIILRPGKERATQELLKILSSEAGIDKRRVHGQTVYDLQFKPEHLLSRLSFFESSGLFVMASSSILIEKAIIHLNTHKGKPVNKNFERLRSTRGSKVTGNIYVNYPELSRFLKKILLPDKINHLNNFAEFSAMDVDIKPDYISLNGFTGTSDSTVQFLSILKDQEPVNFSIDNIIPSNVAFFRLSGFSNPKMLFDNMKSFEKSSGDANLKNANTINNDSIDIFLPDLSAIFNQEAGEVVLKDGKTFEKYFIASLSARSIAEMALSSWLKSFVEKKGGNLSSFIKQAEPGNNDSPVIYKSPISGLPSVIFPGLYPDTKYSHFSFINNYIVFGNSHEAVRTFLYINSLGKTLNNDKYFNELKNNFDSKSNLFIYLDPSAYFDEILLLMNKETQKTINDSPKSWKKINAVSLQSTSSGDLNYFHIFLNFSGNIREYVNTVWERKLDTVSMLKPVIVSNHNTNEKEIFTQDKSNNIYLINNTGRILWKQQIDGPILDDVHQIDYFNNGKLQLIFNTRSKIYLIDRNGNPVGRFPVGLRENASAGLSLFDYDKDGTIRICIPLENHDICMYDREGKILQGWNFKKSDFPIKNPVKHFRIGDKDFIVANDKMKVYFLDRQGRERIKPKIQIEHSPNNPIYKAGSHSSGEYLTGTDTSGSIYNFYFDGNVKKVLDLSLSKNHHFIPSDLNGNGNLEYIFADMNKLVVYSPEGNLLFDELLPEQIIIKPVIYEFSAIDKKVGIVADKSGRIYLYNADGSLYQGFPLQGTSAFSISNFPGLLDRFNLIVANNDNFLYNYSVK